MKTMLILKKCNMCCRLLGIVPCFLTSSALENHAWACLFLRSENESNSPLKCTAKMGKSQLFTEKHRVSHFTWGVADWASVSLSSVNRNSFFWS